MGKLFGTDGIRGKANLYPITAELALLVGRAIAYHMTKTPEYKHKRPRVLIGKDTRISCYMLENAIAAGLCSGGADVILTGPLPTPAISYLTKQMRAAAGIVISASHNHYSDNGIKIFSGSGLKLSDEEELVIEELILTEKIKDIRATEESIGRIKRIDHAYGRYVNFLKQNFPQDLDLGGMKIVVDCANGASYKVAPTVLEELGAEVLSFGVSPNGTNINDGCGAQHTENISNLVKKHNADIGIALDGDADRVILVDNAGKIVDGDKILAITAIDMIKAKKLKHSTVVATVMSNMGLEASLKEHGGKLVRTKVGDRYVIEKMKEKGYNLGGEKSGHLVFSDSLFTGDGMLGALKVLGVMKRLGVSLSTLSSKITLFPQHLRSIPVTRRVDLNKLPILSKRVLEIEKFFGLDGRIVLRYSGTEPKIRLMIEGKDEAKVISFMNELEELIKKELV